MILADYFKSQRDICWDFAKQCGVRHGVIRLPEDPEFEVTDFAQFAAVHKRFADFGVKPVIIEPMPNALHDHIKIGDEKRDWAIEQVIKMFANMDALDIRTICFNWMAHIGWLRTDDGIRERGDALVTGFRLEDHKDSGKAITAEQLWDNYAYFLKAVIPEAEKHNIRLALHPDDPPLEKLHNVSRIMVNYQNIDRAINAVVPSENLGITMCQATFHMMGEDLYKVIPAMKDKIFFVHFRNTTGHKTDFRETFHDNGDLDMPALIRLYKRCGIHVPIRVDHVPLMAGEKQETAGYTALGRLYAIGYLKGILQAEDCLDQ